MESRDKVKAWMEKSKANYLFGCCVSEAKFYMIGDANSENDTKLPEATLKEIAEEVLGPDEKEEEDSDLEYEDSDLEDE